MHAQSESNGQKVQKKYKLVHHSIHISIVAGTVEVVRHVFMILSKVGSSGSIHSFKILVGIGSS